MHNVEVFVNYDPPCNSVSTARRLNKRSSSSLKSGIILRESKKSFKQQVRMLIPLFKKVSYLILIFTTF